MLRTLLLLVLAIGLALQAPAAIRAEDGSTPRLDRFGDPLPAGAVARLGTLRFHRCSCAAYSPDGKIIATADRDELDLWDAATSKRVRRLPLEDRLDAAGLIYSHDGKKLAVVGWGGSSVQVCDLDTFKVVRLAQGGGSGGGYWGSAAAFSADDKTVFAATSAKLFVWDLATGKKVKEFPLRVGDKPVFGRLVVFSEDGKVAASQGEKKVHLWDTQTGKLLHELESLSSGECMRFSRDGKTLIVPGHGHWMNVFNVATGKRAPSVAVAERVASLAFSPDGKTLAAASNGSLYSSSTDGEQVIQLWDLAKLDGPPVKLPAPGVDSVTFSPDGKTLAWRCHEQTLRFMDRGTGKDLRPTESHSGAIKALAYLPDGKRVVSAGEDGTISVWDAETGESLSVLRGHAGEVSGLAVSPNGKLLASCGLDGTFRLWDVESGKSLAVRKDEGNSVVAAAFSADGKQLASGGNRGVLFLRDPAIGQVLDEFETGLMTASLAFAPDGKTVAVIARHDRKLLLQDLVTKKAKEIEVQRGGSCVAYSPDGKLLAVACDETLLLLDTATNAELRRLPGHFNSRGCVTFSPDGRYLASVSDGWGEIANRSIRVFEVATGSEVHSFKKELPIYAAVFSPDVSRLAVGGADATAVILDLSNLTGKTRRDRLTDDELSARWESLTATDAAKAYEARADLLHAPNSTVPFLARRLQPAPALDARRVEGLIKSLDSESFQERDKAARELEQMGELVREPLRKALAAHPSAEVRRSLQALLDKLTQLAPSQLRTVRAVEVLERIGTPEALPVIKRLTGGNPDGLLTTESRAVLARRSRRSAPLPPSPVARKDPASDQPALPPGPVLADRDGDPMPPGAIARLGSARWRLADEPRRILVSPDGKTLAVVNSYSGVDRLDAQTGRIVEWATGGFFGWTFDLRMGVALSAAWRKVAAVREGDHERAVLAVIERDKAGAVKIEYGRKKESYPLVPEETEDAGNYSSGSSERLAAVDFSPDGKALVGCVRFEWECDGKVKKEIKESHIVAWDAATGKELWKVLALAHDVHTILFSPDGKTVTVADRGGVGFWDFARGREVRRWTSNGPLFSAVYSPDRAWLATGSKDEILLWDAATGKLLRRLAVTGDEIKAVAFRPDGKLLAGGGGKTIRFWDPLTGESRGDCSGFPNPVQAVAFSAAGKTLFSGHEREHALRRWEVAGRQPSGDFGGPVAPVRLLSFSRDGRTALASPTGEDFHLWESKTGKPCPLPDRDDGRLLSECLASSGHAGLLRCEDGLGAQFAMLLTGKVDRLDQLPGFLGSSVDGRRALVRTEKDKAPCLTVLKVKARTKDKEERKNDVEREFVWKDGDEVSAALSPDGTTVAAAGKDVVCFFDVATGGERRYLYPTDVKPGFIFRTESVKFSADGSRVAVVGGDGKVRVVAVKDGRRVAAIATKTRGLTGLAFSPDGQTLLTTSFGSPGYAWEVATGQAIRRLEPATYLFSPDSRTLAGSAGTMKLFDLYSGRVVRECRGEGISFGNFAFSPDGKLLAAACSDTTVVVWPTSAAGARAGGSLDEKSLVGVLENGSATDAYEAIGRMIADPERALAFLGRRLQAAAKLDDDKQTAISPEDVLHMRAVQALERIGTKPAWRLLENLARGAEASPRTQAATEAIGRLRTRED